MDNFSKLKFFMVYKWQLAYLNPYKWRVAGFILVNIIIALSEIIIPRFIEQVIDVIIPNKDIIAFKDAYIVLGVLVLSIIISTIISNNLERSLKENVRKDLTLSMLNHHHRLGFSFFENNPTGQILSYFTSDLQASLRTYTEFAPFFIKAFILVVICFILIIQSDYRLIFIIIGCLILYSLVRPYINYQIIRYLGLQTETKHNYDQQVYDILSAYEDIKINNIKEWTAKSAEYMFKKFKESRIKSLFWRFTSVSINIGVEAIANIFFYTYCFILFKGNALSLGLFVSNSFYFIILYRYMTRIVGRMNEQINVLKHAECIYDFMNIEQPLENSGSLELIDIKGKLSFKDVDFYYNNNCIFKKFNLEIAPGERVAIVGTTGCGKSTLLKLAMSFYRPQNGEILIDDIPLSNISSNSLTEAQGIVFQDTYLFGISIKENIKFGRPEATDEEVVEAAKAAYIHEFIESLPEGYDTDVGERGIKLSGGQKQRLAIARMIIKEPTMVFLDEATSALDNVSEVAIKNFLNSFTKGKTTIVVAHRLSTIKDFDRIIMLREGQVVGEGTYEGLRNSSSEFGKWTKEGDVG